MPAVRRYQDGHHFSFRPIRTFIAQIKGNAQRAVVRQTHLDLVHGDILASDGGEVGMSRPLFLCHPLFYGGILTILRQGYRRRFPRGQRNGLPHIALRQRPRQNFPTWHRAFLKQHGELIQPFQPGLHGLALAFQTQNLSLQQAVLTP